MKTGRGFAPLHELVKIVRIRRPEHRTHHSQHHGHPWCPMAPMHQPAHMPCLRCWWLPLPDAALSMGHEHGWVSWVGSPQQRCCPDAGSIFTGTAASSLGVWRTRHVSCQMTMAGWQSRAQAEWPHFQRLLGSTSLCHCHLAFSARDALTLLAPAHAAGVANCDSTGPHKQTGTSNCHPPEV